MDYALQERRLIFSSWMDGWFVGLHYWLKWNRVEESDPIRSDPVSRTYLDRRVHQLLNALDAHQRMGALGIGSYGRGLRRSSSTTSSWLDLHFARSLSLFVAADWADLTRLHSTEMYCTGSSRKSYSSRSVVCSSVVVASKEDKTK